MPEETVNKLLEELRREGIIVLPNLLLPERLKAMQQAFEVKLRRLRWNNFDGYQKTEPYRHMVEDVLLLEQGFVDLAIHPLVKEIMREYIGPNYELTEAKGWKSLPTKRDFHGWHGDAWYDADKAPEIHKELKLAMYLTDVRSGAFNYIRGSHRKQHPRPVKSDELDNGIETRIAELTGPAGSAFIFDTSGIHRQGVPMLEPRQAIFYNYHDPNVSLQAEDVNYYRYHPLLLNAAFLGNLSDEDRRVLGFGNQTNYIPAFERQGKPSFIYRTFTRAFGAQLRLRQLSERIMARLRK
ncbi:MAG: phytanoyl-CoA dioxygenase family protein [Pyrinomonadaceae bacterium]